MTFVTTNTRKEITTLIEDFEEHGRLPYRVSGDRKHQEAVKPMTNYAQQKAKLEAKLAAEKMQQEGVQRQQSEEEKKAALIEKKRAEKEVRKQQYAVYMRGLQGMC